MTTTTETALTREEAAYAHLASFHRGEHIVIGGHGLACDEAVVTTAQHEDPLIPGMEGAYLTAAITGIGGDDGWVRISVADLLSGLRHIEHDGDGQWNGNLTCFDPAGYAAQNPEG